MPHELVVERLGSGVTMGECSCGAWEMRVGPDVTSVRHETEEELLRRNFLATHVDEAAQRPAS